MVSDEIISPSAYQSLLTIRRKEHSDLEVIAGAVLVLRAKGAVRAELS